MFDDKYFTFSLIANVENSLSILLVIPFLIFVIIFGELMKVRKLKEVEATLEPGSNP